MGRQPSSVEQLSEEQLSKYPKKNLDPLTTRLKYSENTAQYYYSIIILTCLNTINSLSLIFVIHHNCLANVSFMYPERFLRTNTHFFPIESIPLLLIQTYTFKE